MGLSPFYIPKEIPKTPRFFALICFIRTTYTLSSYLYLYFVDGLAAALPTRIEISLITSLIALMTVIVDYFLLQLLLLVNHSRKGRLLLQIFALKEKIYALEEIKEKRRRWKLISIELTIKMTIFIISMIALIIVGVDLIVATFSFSMMVNSIILQFAFNRIYLDIISDSLEKYLKLFKGRNFVVVEILKDISNCIRGFEKEFKIQNLILIKFSFVITLLFTYYATVLVIAFNWIASIIFFPIIAHTVYDLTIFVRVCHNIQLNIDRIKQQHNVNFVQNDNAVSKSWFGLRIRFICTTLISGRRDAIVLSS